MATTMVGWHHWVNGHKFGPAPGVGDGQGNLACCSSWGCKESDMTEQLNWTDRNNWNLFLTVLEAGSLWSLCQNAWVLVRALLWVVDIWHPALSSRGRKRELWSLQSLIISVTQAHPLYLITTQRPHILIPSHWELGFQYMSTGEHKYSIRNILHQGTNDTSFVIGVLKFDTLSKVVSARSPSTKVPFYFVMIMSSVG